MAFYCSVAQQFSTQPVIVRTLDIGGDKPLAYLQPRHEDNPFLGCRGIRFCLQHSQIFTTQLRALLRTRAQYANVKIMLPMVATLNELQTAQALLSTAHQALLKENVASVMPEVGIMIEVPAAVAQAELLARHADFFSIGTNDLTQYVMAADRGNPQVSQLVTPLQPAVLSMIARTIEAAHHAGIRVGMCGEMAGNPKFTELLTGLGIDELSMSAVNIAAVKAQLRRCQWRAATTKAARLLTLSDSAQISAGL